MPAITFSGLASGIDADAIIKTMLDSKRLANKPFEAKLDENKTETAALEEFNTKLLSLNDSVREFLTLNGSAITKSAVVSNEDAISVSTTNAAQTATATIDVTQLARGGTGSANDRFTSMSSPLAPGITGTSQFTITSGIGDQQKTYTIPVTASTTLADLSAAINEQAEDRVHSAVINLGTDAAPQYTIVLTSTETGVEKGSLSITAGAELTSAGVFQSFTVDQAKDAIFTISGIGQLTRASNKISGVIPGVEIDLKQSGFGPVQITVNDDRDKTAAKFEKFVGLLNELIKFSQEGNKIERSEERGSATNTFGPLAKIQIDNQAITALKNAISDSNSAGAGTEVNSFADLGLTTERDGTFKFDRDKFLEALGQDAQGASKLLNGFADRVGSTGGIIDDYTRFQGLIETATTSNDDENKRINERLDRFEATLADQERSLRLLFTNLEKKISELNSTQSAITGILSSAGTSKR